MAFPPQPELSGAQNADVSVDMLPAELRVPVDVLLIDNFDSFTWNLYQQLCLLGAKVTVIRNDAIAPSLFPLLSIKSLIISPGPGHPKTDSGISGEAVKYWMGKVPIFGVCMGLEVLVDLFGGSIAYAGEIMHGKVSHITHDARGCFSSLSQSLACIRYHSLSASFTSLPPSLAVTAVTDNSNVIMGVRHREYTIEAVQYHPESILSEEGDRLMGNFLKLRGGYWEENPEFNVVKGDSSSPFTSTPVPAGSKATKKQANAMMEKIYTERVKDVAKTKLIPGQTELDLQTALSLQLAPPTVSLSTQLRSSSPTLIAEIRRASPTKGQLNSATPPATLAKEYALAGVHAISIQTDHIYTAGSLADLRFARLALSDFATRPAIIRRDIIVSRYQILEARVAGADAIVLSYGILPRVLLAEMVGYVRELGMESVVEVARTEEVEWALKIRANVIAVRGDQEGILEEVTTKVAGTSVVVASFAGVESAEDVGKAITAGANAVLVGDKLVLSKDRSAFVRTLLSLPSPSSSSWTQNAPLVKICGVRTSEEALDIADAGADMLGLMFVKKSKRYIDIDTAREICNTIRSSRPSSSSPLPPPTNVPWLTSHATAFLTARPQLVGVFQNASLEEVQDAISYCGLDLVQLHGAEPVEWSRFLSVPAIKVFHLPSSSSSPSSSSQSTVDDITRGGYHAHVLLDSVVTTAGVSQAGGTGATVDWDFARRIADAGEIVVNVEEAYRGDSRPGDRPMHFVQPIAPKAEQQEVQEAREQVHEKDEEVHPDGVEEGPESTEELGYGGMPMVLETKPQKAFHYRLPIILAGGLTAENVAEAVRTVRPWAVDVSGGVESDDGRGKDLDKVRAFVAEAKALVPEE